MGTGDDDDPLTDLDVEIKISRAGAVVSGTPDPLPADSEPSTMEPRTFDPRLAVHRLTAASKPAAPSKPAKGDREDPAPFEFDDDSELSIQTVEARVIDAHRGLVARKNEKSPTIRGTGLEEGETVRVFATKSEPDDIEPTEEEGAAEDNDEVTALDSSLLAGGKDLAAAAAAATVSIGNDDDDDEPPTASVRRPPLIALPSNDLVTDPGIEPAARVIPAIPRSSTVSLATRVAAAAPPDAANRTLEMPRPAFVKLAAAPVDGPVSSRVSSRGQVPDEPKRSRGLGTLAVIVLAAGAFGVGVAGTLFVVKREPSNVGALDTRASPSAPPAPSSSSASPATAASSESPAAAAALPSAAPSVASSSVSSSGAHRAPPPLTPGRPPLKPAPKSSVPMHL